MSGVGQATLDTIFELPHYPDPDGCVVAESRAVAGGGPAATAAVAVARLGVEAAFVGAVGDDDVGHAIRLGLEREGVDITELAVAPNARSPESTILVERGSGARTIIHFPGSLPRLELSRSARALCEEAAWVHSDQIGYPAVRGLDARMSVDGGNPIAELDLTGIELYVPTEAALREAFGSLDEAIYAGARVIVVTRGAAGSTALTKDGERIEVAGLEISPVSTLGAGDVYHGALLAWLARGASLSAAMRAANAAAALSCRAPTSNRWSARMSAYPVRPARVYRSYRGGELIGWLRGEPEADSSFPEDWVGSTTPAVNPGREDQHEGLAELDGGRLVRDAIEAEPAHWLGHDHVERFGSSTGLLVKLLDSAERLPVHAHPSRAFARAHLASSFGKTEAWIVLATREDDAEVWVGLRERVETDGYRTWIERQDTDIPPRVAQPSARRPRRRRLRSRGHPPCDRARRAYR